jgi:hypothetical protein
MTPDQQRTAIAKICGWTDIRRQRLYAGDQDLWGTKLIGGDKHRNRLPNYLADLNAMHEAEEMMTEEQRIAHSDNAYDIACRAQRETGKWRWISLTAPQRAEAFLRTLNLWQSTPTQPQ